MAQNVKSVCDVVIANVKTVCDVTKANVKTLVGVDNTSGGSPTVTLVGGNTVDAAAASATISTSVGIDVNAGDVIVVFGGIAGNRTVTCASSPSVGTFTEVRDNFDATNSYSTAVYRLVATASQTGVIFTLTFSVSDNFRTIGAAVFRTSSGTFSFDAHTTQGTPGQLQATSTSRTSSNLTTAVADSLLVGLSIDWDGTTHTGANSFAVAFDGVTQALMWKQVASTGSYPNGNFATVNPTDRYFGDFLAFSIT